MENSRYDVHVCGGGYSSSYDYDRRSEFKCSEYNVIWTSGYDGYPYLNRTRNSKTDNGVEEKK
jgi:hypothetical protein